MGAEKQHGGFAIADLAFDPCQRMQALAGEPLGEQRQEVGNAGAAGKLVVGGVQEPFDGLSVPNVAAN